MKLPEGQPKNHEPTRRDFLRFARDLVRVMVLAKVAAACGGDDNGSPDACETVDAIRALPEIKRGFLPQPADFPREQRGSVDLQGDGTTRVAFSVPEAAFTAKHVECGRQLVITAKMTYLTAETPPAARPGIMLPGRMEIAGPGTDLVFSTKAPNNRGRTENITLMAYWLDDETTDKNGQTTVPTNKIFSLTVPVDGDIVPAEPEPTPSPTPTPSPES